MKKLTVILLSLTLIITLVGCKSDNKEPEVIESPEEVEVVEETKTPEVEVEPEEIKTPEVTVEETPEELEEDTNIASSDNQPAFKVEWADDVLSEIPDYNEYTAPDSVPESRVVFIAQKVINDFKILNIEFLEASEDGEIIFNTKEVYKPESLTPDKPLLANFSFFGTIPNNGISYVDEDGNTQYYTINVSGKDGSLVIDEFIPAQGE